MLVPLEGAQTQKTRLTPCSQWDWGLNSSFEMVFERRQDQHTPQTAVLSSLASHGDPLLHVKTPPVPPVIESHHQVKC